jgi:outer membrane immunogenic protein
MRRTALAVFAIVTSLAVVRTASSADLSLPPIYRAAPPAYGPFYGARLYDWTSCYVGLNAGGVWGHMENTWTPNNIVPVVVSSFEANGSSTIDASGFTGGGQVGCTWQVGQVVGGVEADFQYTGLNASRDVVDSTVLAPLGPISFHEDFSSKWLATARGRFGWLATPFVLLYATGGAAFAEIDTVDSAINLSNPAEFISVSGSDTRVGWTAGAGVEWKFAQHWSVRAEYLFVNLGSFTTTSVDSLGAAATVNHDHHLTENLVRAGINFHF